jgi:hypothetical protein
MTVLSERGLGEIVKSIGSRKSLTAVMVLKETTNVLTEAAEMLMEKFPLAGAVISANCVQSLVDEVI